MGPCRDLFSFFSSSRGGIFSILFDRLGVPRKWPRAYIHLRSLMIFSSSLQTPGSLFPPCDDELLVSGVRWVHVGEAEVVLRSQKGRVLIVTIIWIRAFLSHLLPALLRLLSPPLRSGLLLSCKYRRRSAMISARYGGRSGPCM